MPGAGAIRQFGEALTAWLLRIGLVRAVLVIAAFSVLSSVMITVSLSAARAASNRSPSPCDAGPA